ncbi:MFS transporter [Tellurirhabdus rosea]|uniref:MFS transporter n=1 Tax=Tellurirhabdus rosea TaxID=2674997 RepID=UPI002259BA8A|nr:MFS transporter [Tellurirhabdus rosea]
MQASLPATRPYPLSLRDSRPLRYVTFFYLYVMQGIPAGFALYALANYLTAKGLTSAAVGQFAAVVGFPWAIQFVWGPVIDKYQGSAMGERRPWVLLAQFLAFLASLGILLVDDPVRQIGMLSVVLFIHSVFASVQDASVDALAISVIPERERGRINAFMRGGFLSGISLGAALLSYLMRNEGFTFAAAVQSALLLAFTVLTFFIKEQSDDALLPTQARPVPSSPDAVVRPRSIRQNHALNWLFRELFRGLTTRRSLLLFLPMLAYYACVSVFNRAYSYHLISRLGWADTDVSVLQGTLGTGIILAVVLTGGVLADRFGPARLLLVVMVFNCLSYFVFNLLSPYWTDPTLSRSILVLWTLMDPIFSVASMPLLMALCRRHVEGSQFTTYMALVNLCDIIGAYTSGQAQMHLSAPTIGLLCGGVMAVALGVAARGVRYAAKAV